MSLISFLLRLRRLFRRLKSKGPFFRGNEARDKVVQEINHYIALVIYYSRREAEDWKSRRDDAMKCKKALEEVHAAWLGSYLQPYVGLSLQPHQVTHVEWARYRVARNLGKCIE